MSLRATRLDPTFAIAALFKFSGTIPTPSSRASAFEAQVRMESLGSQWKFLAMVLGFIVFWPIGLAVLVWKFWLP